MRRIYIGILIFLSFWTCIILVKADYFSNHQDWPQYCLRAKDIWMTQQERDVLLEEGHLSNKIIDRSQLIVKEFHASNSIEHWSMDMSDYAVDIEALEQIILIDENSKEIVSARMYVDAQDKTKNYIDIKVTLVKEQKQIPQDVSNEIAGNNLVFRKELIGDVLLGMGLIETGIFIPILYSNYRVLWKYKRKIKEGGTRKDIWQ